MFYAKTFIFDDEPSEFYNLYLGELSGSGEEVRASSNDVALLTTKIFRRATPLFWGAEQTPVLSFPLSMYSPDEITAEKFSKLSGWLFGQMSYKQLRICQSDMMDVYFNAFLTAPQIIRVGNIIRGMTCTVVCDSPFGWKQPKTYSYSYTGSYIVYDTINYYNESANSFYTYPSELEIVGNGYGGTITLVNTTDDATRSFVYTLAANETITLDCYNQFISSDSRQYPLNYFNLNWLRFLRGFNTITVVGTISSMSITSEIAVKIG